MAQSEGIIVTLQRIWLIRHGETEWSLSGQHTGSTDIPLTDIGAERARLLKGHMENHQFNAVLTSPLQRAQETCRLAGYGDHADRESSLPRFRVQGEPLTGRTRLTPHRRRGSVRPPRLPHPAHTPTPMDPP